MSLKPVSHAIENHVRGIWDKGLIDKVPEEIVYVEQYSPTKDLINEFESRRNELDRALGGKKLQTVQAFICVGEESLRSVLMTGFHKTLGNTKLAFSTDPSVAIREGPGKNGREIILCRITLGREGVEYQLVREKYVLENTRGIIPAFLITYSLPGEAVSLKPLDLGTPAGDIASGYDDEIVFHEAKVVKRDVMAPEHAPGGHHRNVFGDDKDVNAEEEDRLLKYINK